ncbi:MAG TPA: DUF2281 domain-containing protein [Chloroflexi bacterium]|nr:DUF2281 domain-containing protein [Chloroflexota bacterium]
MSTQVRSLQQLVQELPPEIPKSETFEFLLAKQSHRARKVLQQEWAGALRDYREQYTSLELERQALAWRGE